MIFIYTSKMTNGVTKEIKSSRDINVGEVIKDRKGTQGEIISKRTAKFSDTLDFWFWLFVITAVSGYGVVLLIINIAVKFYELR